MKNADNNHDMDNLLMESAKEEAPLEVQECLRRHLSDFEQRMNQAETSQKESFIMTIVRRKTRWMTVTAVATIAVLFVAVFSFVGGGSRLAFADVLEQLREFRPYACTFTIERHGKRIYSKDTMRDSLTRRREVMEDGSIQVVDLGLNPIRILTLYPEKKLAIERVYTDSVPMQDPDLLAIISGIQEGEAEDLGFKEIDGKRSQGFHRPDENNDFTIWVDPETGLPLQVDLLHVKKDQRIIMTNFDFETPLDASLFSTAAPEGYEVRAAESLLNPEPTTPGPFKPYSCRQVVTRKGKIVNDITELRLDTQHCRVIGEDEIAVSDLSGKHPLCMELTPSEKKAVITTLGFLKGTMNDPDLVAMSISLRDGSEEYLGWEIVEGRNAEGFCSVSPGNEMTFWLDAETKLPLRVEFVHTLNDQKIVMDQFDFDVDFDDSLFKIEAPEGYTVRMKTKR